MKPVSSPFLPSVLRPESAPVANRASAAVPADPTAAEPVSHALSVSSAAGQVLNHVPFQHEGPRFPPPTADLGDVIEQLRAGSDKNLRDMLVFAQQYSQTDRTNLSPAQQALLEQIPAALRNRMPELAQRLQAEAGLRDILNNTMRHPETMQELLSEISSLAPAVAEMNAGDLRQALATASAKLSPEARSYFHGLGLHEPANTSLLLSLAQRTAPIQAALQQHLTGANPNNKADYSARMAALNTQLMSQVDDLQGLDMAQHRDGAARLMLLARQLDSGSQQLMQRLLQHSDDLAAFQPEVDIHAGLSAVVLRSFQHASTQPAAERQAVADLLSRLQTSPTAELSSADQQRLLALGLGLSPQGQVLNLVNHQVLDTQALQTLTDMTRQLDRAQSRGIQEGQLGASLQLSANMQRMLTLTGRANELEVAIQAGNQRLQTLSTQAESLNANLNLKTQEIIAARSTYDQTVSENAVLTEVLAPFMTEGEPLHVEELLEQADLPQLNTVLRPMGLEVKRERGRPPRVQTTQGETVSIPAFRGRMGAYIQERLALQRTQHADLAARETELSALTAESHAIEAQIATATQSQQGLVTEYGSVLTDLQELPLDELALELQDPALRASLSPEDLTRLEQGLADARRHVTEGPDLIAESQAQIERARQAGAELKETRQAAEAELALTRASLARGGELLKDLQQLKNATLSPQQNTQLQQVLQEANRLGFLLNLNPRPASVDVSALFSEWQDLLRHVSQDFNQQFMAQLNQQTLAQRRLDQEAERARENQQYHQQKLGDLDSRRQADLEALLRESLEQARQTLH